MLKRALYGHAGVDLLRVNDRPQSNPESHELKQRHLVVARQQEGLFHCCTRAQVAALHEAAGKFPS
jgi:hypothetical protein